jgi:hypothetical protein
LSWTYPRPQIIEGVLFRVLEVIKVITETEITNKEHKDRIAEFTDLFLTSLSILFMNHEKLINKTQK